MVGDEVVKSSFGGKGRFDAVRVGGDRGANVELQRAERCDVPFGAREETAAALHSTGGDLYGWELVAVQCTRGALGMPKSGSRGPKTRAKLTSDLVAMLFDASRSGWVGADTLCDGSGLGVDGFSIFSHSERKRFDCWLR